MSKIHIEGDNLRELRDAISREKPAASILIDFPYGEDYGRIMKRGYVVDARHLYLRDDKFKVPIYCRTQAALLRLIGEITGIREESIAQQEKERAAEERKHAKRARLKSELDKL